MKAQRSRPTRRVRRVPPPLTRPRGPLLPAAGQIHRESPDEAGFLLWRSCRNVELWALPGPAYALFPEGALETRRAAIAAGGLDPALREPLEVIAGLLANPRVVEASRVADACGEVARWAHDRGKLGTALAFAQAGALADPENAGAAVLVGRMARMRAEYDRAESWFDQALMLARKGGDRQAYTEALAGLGNLHVQKGSFPKARELHLRCLRAAKRYSLHEMQGAALHNLYMVALDCDSWAEAQGFAERALDAFPAGSPGLLRLAQDVAFHWVARGLYRPALTVMQELLPCFQDVAVRIVILAHVARAAAGMHSYDVFEGAWAQTWSQLGDSGAEPGAARALIGLAYAAASLSEWSRAERACVRALHLATLRDEECARAEAELLLSSTRERRLPRGADAGHTDQPSEQVVARFTRVLRESHAAVASV